MNPTPHMSTEKTNPFKKLEIGHPPIGGPEIETRYNANVIHETDGKTWEGFCTIGSIPLNRTLEEVRADKRHKSGYNRARLIVAAVNSYGAHCSDPVKEAEVDLLGDALKALEELASRCDAVQAVSGGTESHAAMWRATGQARAVLARGKVE